MKVDDGACDVESTLAPEEDGRRQRDVYCLDLYSVLVKMRLQFFSVVCIAYAVVTAVGGFVQQLITPYMIEELDWRTSFEMFYIAPVFFIITAAMVDALFDLWWDINGFPLLVSCRTTFADIGVPPWAIDAGFIAIFEGIWIIGLLSHLFQNGVGGSPNLIEPLSVLVECEISATLLLGLCALFNRIFRRMVRNPDHTTEIKHPIGAALLEKLRRERSFLDAKIDVVMSPDTERAEAPGVNGTDAKDPLVDLASRDEEQEADGERMAQRMPPRMATRDRLGSFRDFGLVDWKTVLGVWAIVHALMLTLAFVMPFFLDQFDGGPQDMDAWKVLLGMSVVTLLLLAAQMKASPLGRGFEGCLLLVAIFCLLGFLLAFNDDAQGKNEKDYPRLLMPPAHESRNESEPHPSSRYPICDTRWGSDDVSDKLTVVDLGMFSWVAYLTGDNAKNVLDSFAKDTALEGTEIEDQSPEYMWHRGGAFKVLSIPKLRTYVVAVRGTHEENDILFNLGLYSKVVLMQTFAWLVPMFTCMPARWIRSVVASHEEMWLNVNREEMWTKLINSTRVWQNKSLKEGWDIVITGHSLGGALSAIVGAQLQIPTVAFSAPGNFYSMEKFAMTENNVSLMLVNVVPQYDIVPQVDKQAGMVQNIKCAVHDGSAPFMCHPLERTICELYRTCGDTRARQWAYPNLQPDPENGCVAVQP